MNHYQKVIYNCRQATFLIEKKAEVRLSLSESLELRLHLAGCSICKLYQRQSGMIGKMVHDLMHTKGDAILEESFKKELQKKIEEQIQN